MITKLFEGTAEEITKDLLERVDFVSKRKVVIYAEIDEEHIKDTDSKNDQYPIYVMGEEGKVEYWDEEKERFIYLFPEELPKNHIEHPSNREWLRAKIQEGLDSLEKHGGIPATPEFFEGVKREAKGRLFAKYKIEGEETPQWLKDYLEKQESK